MGPPARARARSRGGSPNGSSSATSTPAPCIARSRGSRSSRVRPLRRRAPRPARAGEPDLLRGRTAESSSPAPTSPPRSVARRSTAWFRSSRVIPQVREVMRERQRELGHDGDVVIEGRDIGTVVAPGGRGEGLPRRGSEGARAAPARGAAGDRRRRARHRPAHARCRATPRACSRPPTRTRSTRRASRSTTSSTRSKRLVRARPPAGVTTGGRPSSSGRPGASTWGCPRAWSRARAPTAASAVPREGGVVLAVNHLHWIDVPILGALSPRNLDFVAKVEAVSFPGFGRFVSWHGTIGVRRGESDRDAVRQMREAVRDGRCARAVRRGNAPANRPARGRRKPGAAMVAIQEEVPVVPAAIYGTQFWKLGNFAPCSIAFGQPMDFGGLPKNGRGYKEATAEIEARIHEPVRLARRRARPRPPEGRDAAVTTENGLVGTVAIVGFPNVGKSTLVNRLTGTRAAVVHETPGVTRDRKELVCEWNGKQFLLIDTGGVDIADADADDARDRRAGARGRRRGRPRALRRRREGGHHAGRRGDRADPARVAQADARAREQDRRSGAGRRSRYDLHRLGLGDPIPVSGLHGYGTGDLLDEVLELLPGIGRAQIGEDAIRVAILGRPNVGKSSLLNALRRPGAGDRLGDAWDDARLDRHGAERGDTTFVLVDTAGMRRKRQAAAGDRVLLGAARARGCGARRRRARPGRRVGGRGRPGSRRRRRRAQGDVLDDRRPLEVGRRHRRDRGRSPAARGAASPATAADRGLGEDRPGRRPAARPDRAAVREAHGAHLHRRAEPLPGRAARGPAAAAAGGPAAQPALRDADEPPAAALPLLRERSFAHDARLRLLGREPVARAVRARGRARWRSTSCGADENRRRRRRLVGHGVLAAAARARPRGDARVPRPGAGAGDRGDGAQPALPAERRPFRRCPRDSPWDRSRRGGADRARGAVEGVRRRRALAAGDGAGAVADEGARSRAARSRLSTLVTERPVAVLSGPNMAEEIARGPADGRRDRVRGRGARGGAAAARSTRSSSASTSIRTSPASSSAPPRRT